MGTRYTVPAVLALIVVATVLLRSLFGGLFKDTSTFGFQDWDAHSVYRFTPLVHLLRYHEGPWWNPWMCGGFPDWGYAEGATNVVSPYLPAYLLLPLQLAERFEIVGDTCVALVATYLLGGRATSLVSVRAFGAVVYGLNGRWAMQAAIGHTWHLQYAWTPLVIYCFIRSVEEKQWRWTAWGGVVLAGILYLGGIYPLPHTALLLGAFCFIYAITSHSWRPFNYGAVLGVVSIGLAAPKLVPVFLTMSRFPREIESTEQISLSGLLAALVAPGQTLRHGPVPVSAWGWHEYGTYVGWPVVVMLGLFLVLGRGARERAFSLLAISLFVLSLGAFAPYAPWVLLHHLPIFKSQHVPSRFTQVALLVAVFGVAMMMERWSRHLGNRRWWLDLALLLPVCWIASNLAANAKPSFDRAFVLHSPETAAAPAFHHETRSTAGNLSSPTQSAMMPAIRANTGVLDCYGYPLSYYYQDGVGALATTSKRYQGEAYRVGSRVDATPILAEIIRWTPNSATVRLPRAHGGDQLVYNMNYDPGWRANGRSTYSFEGRVAVPLAPNETKITFAYQPPGLCFGLIVAALTLAGLGAALVHARRRRPS
jgi:hypothetical protein